MDYKTIQQQCLQSGYLYEDPVFPAVARSIYYSKVDNNIVWRRPYEIVQNPKFVVGGKSRFDLYQGEIGNCWYIAAAASIATKLELFQRVVPEDQGFDEGYAGIFRFYFWQFGKWIEVVIDDRLPTNRSGYLIFCQNRKEPNEFWPPLLEKAYAKFYGSYEALQRGWSEDALVDFTGGIGERQDLRNKKEIPTDLFERMLNDYTMNSLFGALIDTKETPQKELPNGLFTSHIYSITKVVHLADKQTNMHKLIRLRNPWGMKEWKGSWGDNSRSWAALDEAERRKMCIDDEDGEFWMSYEDWVNNFDELHMCHLPPDNRIKEKHIWKDSSFHGQWVRGVSAGGCGNSPYQDMYWTNPQYTIVLKESDRHNGDKLCSVIIALLQKHSRQMKTISRNAFAYHAMSVDLYKIRSPSYVLLDEENYSQRALQLVRERNIYRDYREICHNIKLEPGNYVIIPSLFEINKECKFLLRCYTKQDMESLEMDTPTERIMIPNKSDTVVQQIFHKYAGSDKVVDAKELQLILNESYQEELGRNNQFDLESSRSLLAMMDENKSGVLEWQELQKMWTELKVWREVFKQFDKDNSGSIDTRELRSIFKSIGYSLSRNVLTAVVRRYGGKNCKLSFSDFVTVVCKVVVHMEIFAKHSKDGGLKGEARFYLDNYMETVLYL